MAFRFPSNSWRSRRQSSGRPAGRPNKVDTRRHSTPLWLRSWCREGLLHLISARLGFARWSLAIPVQKRVNSDWASSSAPSPIPRRSRRGLFRVRPPRLEQILVSGRAGGSGLGDVLGRFSWKGWYVERCSSSFLSASGLSFIGGPGPADFRPPVLRVTFQDHAGPGPARGQMVSPGLPTWWLRRRLQRAARERCPRAALV